MIEATISHSNEGRQDDLDLSLFLDFDLAILGQDAEGTMTITYSFINLHV